MRRPHLALFVLIASASLLLGCREEPATLDEVILAAATSTFPAPRVELVFGRVSGSFVTKDGHEFTITCYEDAGDPDNLRPPLPGHRTVKVGGTDRRIHEAWRPKVGDYPEGRARFLVQHQFEGVRTAVALSSYADGDALPPAEKAAREKEATDFLLALLEKVYAQWP